VTTASVPLTHLSPAVLALFARGDLAWPKSWKVRLHLRACAPCREQVERFQAASLELKREAESETLTGFEAIADWNRLEREMLGNIGVGVAAARCIDPPRPRFSLLSPWTFATLLLALFTVGWVTHIPRRETEHLVGSLGEWVGLHRIQRNSASIRTTSAGIAVRAQGGTLTIMNPPSAVVTSFGSSAVSARFIDEETGQVTITRVYAQ